MGFDGRSDDPVPPLEAAYVDAVVRRLADAFGSELVAIWPTGSLALHGYTPNRSDIDLVAVVERPPPLSALRTVAASLAHDALPCPAAGLELVLYAREAVSSGDIDAGYALDLNTGRELPPKAASIRATDRGSGTRSIDRSPGRPTSRCSDPGRAPCCRRSRSRRCSRW